MRGSGLVMDPQSQELAREISEAVTAALTEAVEKRLQLHFEGVREQVKLGAEGYGATLESIDRRLDRLEREWKRNFRLHSKVLKNHSERLGAIEKRS